MGRNDFFDIEEKIRNAVDTAFDYVDQYAGVRSNALNEVKNHLRRSAGFAQDTFDNFNRKYNEKRYTKDRYGEYNTYNASNIRDVSPYIERKPAGRISNIFLSGFGILGCVGFGIAAFVIAVVLIPSKDPSAAYVGKVLTGSFSLAFVLSLSSAFVGSNIRNRIKRFKRYASCFGEKKYCKIDLLASSVGESNKFVIKDLGKMIKLGMFKQAYLDDENTYLMLSNEVYENYLTSKEAFAKRKEEVEKEEQKEREEENDTSELGSVVRKGKDYIKQIRNANDAIPGEVISFKLDKLEKVVSAIFSNIEKDAKKIPDVKKFINHYLPMTLKLVNSYKELDSQIVQGENIKKAKQEIEKSIDLINSAFEKLLDDLFADMVMDVSSDISVLETLFSQEGLTDDELRKKNKGR